MVDDLFRIVGTMQAGAYHVEQVVAEGGFAVVYKADHKAFRAPVALKCLKVPGQLSQAHQAEFLERFREEAELLFRLSASIPTVVRPLHVGVLETDTGAFAPFIALEWLDGKTLDKILEDRRADRLRPMPLKKVVRLLTPVAHALDRAHHFPGPEGETSILHRDLKPENILIADVHGEEVAKILDFGIGKVKSAATQIVGKQSSQVDELSAFTPAYGAPEQWLPKRYGQTGPWTDVWGFAITVVEAVCGHAPFEGDSVAIMGSAVDETLRPTPRAEGVETDDAVERVFLRALAVDPKNRYHDVRTFWGELEAALGLSSTQVARARHDPRIEAGSSIPEGDVVGVPGFNLGSVPPSPLADTDAANARNQATVSTPEATVQPAAPPAPIVPDLDIGAPAPRSKPEKQPAPQHITVSRGADPGRMSAAGKPSAPVPFMGANMFEDPDDDFSGSQANAVPTQVELDGIGVSPAPAPMSRARNADAPPPFVSPFETSSIKDKLRTPVMLVLVAVVIMAGAFAYAEVMQERLALGPVRPFWLAGPLMLWGIVLGIARLMGSEH